MFDIIGPVMIGPSSSHTAGAARIGRVARRLLGERPVRAEIELHGSFAKTYRGHGTDRAILGGLLDMDVDDERLRESVGLAEAAGLAYAFRPVTIKGAHPNTLRLTLTGERGGRLCVQAASIGGGSILIQSLDGLEVSFSGEDDTLVIRHRDAPGAIARVTGALAQAGVNIATMRVFRQEEGGSAIMALELDACPAAETVEALRRTEGVTRVTLLEKR